jgi:hypothetical protein
MAKLRCECGELLSNSLFPNHVEGEIRGSYEYKERDVWECDECGRLAIDVIGKDGLEEVKWYVPSDGKPGNLFGVANAKQYEEHLKKLWLEKGEALIKLDIAKIEIKKPYYEDKSGEND